MNETKQQTSPHPLISLAPASACHTMPPLLPLAVNLKKMSIQETNIIGIVWPTVRRITKNQILGVKRSKNSYFV